VLLAISWLTRGLKFCSYTTLIDDMFICSSLSFEVLVSFHGQLIIWISPVNNRTHLAGKLDNLGNQCAGPHHYIFLLELNHGAGKFCLVICVLFDNVKIKWFNEYGKLHIKSYEILKQFSNSVLRNSVSFEQQLSSKYRIVLCWVITQRVIH
jgi:hypothetical protein